MKKLLILAAVAAALASANALLAADAAPAAPAKLDLPVASGPYQPTMKSLKQYECPEWFRDAKFGIWAHWGPQAVPMNGDWYARGMYEQGSGHNKYHVEHYGPPSKFGYKDIIPLWKAEKWDPERLMTLYKKAGAKYFVSMASHHDNFHLWNSKHHRWNSVNMGPKRDVVADWKKAAQKEGLRFGVSEHLGASFTWFQVSHKADKTGPFTGVLYDGADPKYQDLYHFPAAANDTGWYSNNPRWQKMWYDRIQDLVDNYGVDLLYTDGAVPFGNEVGLSLIAHLYNTNLRDHAGKMEVVYSCKQVSEGRWVEDLERGVMPKINPYPWQTDTSIGDWYYNRNWKFRPVSWSIHMLVDIVSKNGNLLLNVVQRPDGSLDPEVEQALEEMAAWNALNGEAIFGTRPWLVYGEGAVKAKGGSFGEDFAYSSQDVRYTTKGGALYATLLGWPKDGKAVIRTLGSEEGKAAGQISQITLLGHEGALTWKRTDEGLVVTLPAEKPCKYAYVLKIIGKDLAPIVVPTVATVVPQAADGSLALLPSTAQLEGGLKPETKAGAENLGFWDNPNDSAEWTVDIKKPGVFQVTATTSASNGPSQLRLETAGASITAKIPATKDWEDYQKVSLGQLTLAKKGKLILKARSAAADTWKAVNLRSITLAPVESAK